MKPKRSSLSSILPKAIAGFLAFWLSSVLVLACCGGHFFRAEASGIVLEEAESCPMGAGHECCKKSKKETPGENISESEKRDTADCCTFKPAKTLSSDLQNYSFFKTSEKALEFEKPRLAFLERPSPAVKFHRSIVRNRGSTYLQNCVFRI